MRTIRLIDPRPSLPARPFGSSEWAEESCLADWSQFERDWLGPEPQRRARHGGWSPLALSALGAFAGAALAAVIALAF
jgi:hypothetical protein